MACLVPWLICLTQLPQFTSGWIAGRFNISNLMIYKQHVRKWLDTSLIISDTTLVLLHVVHMNLCLQLYVYWELYQVNCCSPASFTISVITVKTQRCWCLKDVCRLHIINKN